MKKRLPALLVLLACWGPISAAAQDQDAILALKNRIIDLQNRGDPGFREVTLCAKVLGFGSFVPLETPEVRQGTDLLLYYEPANVFTNRVRGEYEIWYSQDLALLSENGDILYDQKDLLEFHYISRSPVFDLYATNTLNLGSLPPGRYTCRMMLHDRLKDASAGHSLTFTVVR